MIARCSCGKVEYEAKGAPILRVACHCADCREGSRRLEALPGAAPILDRYGGTFFVAYRKDRFRCSKGKELLKIVQVEEGSPKRFFASCCGSAMFADAGRRMHWFSVYRGCLQGEVPPLQMRINVKSTPGSEVPRDVPCSSSFPLGFLARLLTSRLAMVFSR
jgi:hypothetical protein